MNVHGSCYGLFVDLNNYLYCSLKNSHQVVKVLLDNGTTIPTVAAGTGVPGSASNMLNSQQGIYVDNNLNLYIADCGNNRIQLYRSGQTNGITVAENGALGALSLDCPTGIVLDNDGYLFIVDSNNHRIIGSSSNGYRCVVGCSGSGTTSSQLSFPQTMAFDSAGNIYVTDRNNGRVQIYSVQDNNCCKFISNERHTADFEEKFNHSEEDAIKDDFVYLLKQYQLQYKPQLILPLVLPIRQYFQQQLSANRPHNSRTVGSI